MAFLLIFFIDLHFDLVFDFLIDFDFDVHSLVFAACLAALHFLLGHLCMHACAAFGSSVLEIGSPRWQKKTALEKDLALEKAEEAPDTSQNPG